MCDDGGWVQCRWRAYFTSGSSALYLYLYSGFYFYTKLDITQTVPMLMYFSYMFMVSYGFFCLTGTIGFYACYFFVRQIYSAVKVRLPCHGPGCKVVTFLRQCLCQRHAGLSTFGCLAIHLQPSVRFTDGRDLCIGYIISDILC